MNSSRTTETGIRKGAIRFFRGQERKRVIGQWSVVKIGRARESSWFFVLGCGLGEC
jgi:hypothetical protein